MTSQSVLFLRMEPTSYTIALWQALAQSWTGEIQTWFVGERMSQDWGTKAGHLGAGVLPAGPSSVRVSRVREIIQTERPALVHCAGWGDPACRAAIQTASELGIPVFVDLDTWQDSATGLKKLAKRFILPRVFKRVTHFTPAGTRQSSFLQRYEVPRDRITPINMTVDVAAIQSYLKSHPAAKQSFCERYDLPIDAPIFLFLARLAPEKGVEDLLSAWELFEQEIMSGHLVIVGDGELRPLVESMQSDRLHHLGRLSGNAVWEAYSAADLFVAPSRREPWGLTINEAMAAEVPIVMTDAFGCIDDLAIDGETVKIVPAQNPDALMHALVQAIENPAEMSRLRDNATQKISNWTIEAQAERIMQVWRGHI